MTTAAKSTTEDLLLVCLHPAPWNEERPIDEEYIQSFRDKGQVVTALARPKNSMGEFEIVFGHRRAAALRAIGAETMRCEIRDLTDEEAEELGALENAQRRGLSWQQQCALIEGYLVRHSDEDAHARIGSALGLTTSQVKRRARMLANLSPAWAEVLKGEGLPAWTADHFEVVTLFDEKRQESLWKDLGHGVNGLTVAELKECIAREAKALKSAPWDLEDVTLSPKAGACTDCQKRSDCQADLFGEGASSIAKGAHCLDEGCFGKKLAAYHKRKEAEIAEKHPDAIRVATDYNVRGKDTLRPHDYTEAKKGDKGAIPARIVAADGGVKLGYVKVKKEAKEPTEKDAAKLEAKKREARILALAIEKLIAIIEDPGTEFTDDAFEVLVQFCLFTGARVGSDQDDEGSRKRIRAYAKKRATLAELWEAAKSTLVDDLNRAKWGLENGLEADDLPAADFAAWMVEADFAALRKEAEAELSQPTEPPPAPEPDEWENIDTDLPEE